MASQDKPRPLEGQIIEARANDQQAVFLWDATPYVIHLVHDHLLGDPGLVQMERTALLALDKRASTIRSKNVTMRVLYQKVGAVDPIYGTPTFANVERVFSLVANRSALLAHAAEWAQDAARGKMPRELRIEMTGKLPPPH